MGSITATFPAPNFEENLAAAVHPPAPPPITTNLKLEGEIRLTATFQRAKRTRLRPLIRSCGGCRGEVPLAVAEEYGPRKDIFLQYRCRYLFAQHFAGWLKYILGILGVDTVTVKRRSLYSLSSRRLGQVVTGVLQR